MTDPTKLNRLLTLLRMTETTIEEEETKAEQLQLQLRALTGCDCAGLGVSCEGHG